MPRFREPKTAKPPAMAPAGAAAAPRAAAVTAPLSSGLPTSAPAPGNPRLGKPTVLLGFYIFLFASALPEIIAAKLAFSPHIVMIAAILVTLAAFFTGRIGRFLTVPIAKPWIAMYALFLLASVTGTYPRLSTTGMLGYGGLFHILPFFFCAIALTTHQVRHLMYWEIAGFLIVLVLCWRTGHLQDNRFLIPDVPDLGNPNDLAFILVFGCTFALLLVYKRSLLTRLIWAVAFPVAMLYVFKTGSRANFLTLLLLAVVILFLSPRRSKLLFLLVFSLIAGFLAFIVPPATWHRLTLILMDPQAVEVQVQDIGTVGSQIARTELQRRAMRQIIEHPLLGVGPFMFSNAAEEFIQRNEGHKSDWQAPHNVYLQIGAENGFPALLLYVASMIFCVKTNYRSYQLIKNDGARQLERMQSFCLLLASLAYGFGILFCNVTYYAGFAELVAFTASNYLALQDELRTGYPAPTPGKGLAAVA